MFFQTSYNKPASIVKLLSLKITRIRKLQEIINLIFFQYDLKFHLSNFRREELHQTNSSFLAIYNIMYMCTM